MSQVKVNSNPIVSLLPLKMSLREKLHSLWKLHLNRRKIRTMFEATWPEGRKCFEQVMQDMKLLIWKYDCKYKFILKEYFDEGLHRADHPLDEYALLMEWSRLRYIWDYTLYPDVVQKVANKIEFKKILQENGYPVSAVLGILSMQDGEPILERVDGTKEKLDDVLRTTGGIFVKPDNLLQGKGCAKIQLGSAPGRYLINGEYADLAAVADFITKKPESDGTHSITQVKDALLAELLVENHESLRAFHANSLNTLRIIIMRTPSGGVELNRAIMRFGTGGSSVDNLYAGGIGVPVETSTGRLVTYGHTLATDTPPYYKHPDSGLTFDGFEVPFWKESLEMSIEIRRKLFPEVFNIGFDIAITPSGPVMIEANVSSCFFQRTSAGGLRPIMNTWLRPLVYELMKGNPICH